LGPVLPEAHPQLHKFTVNGVKLHQLHCQITGLLEEKAAMKKKQKSREIHLISREK